MVVFQWPLLSALVVFLLSFQDPLRVMVSLGLEVPQMVASLCCWRTIPSWKIELSLNSRAWLRFAATRVRSVMKSATFMIGTVGVSGEYCKSPILFFEVI